MPFICQICNKKFDESFLNVHHRIPKAMGGSDSKENLWNLCAGCHQTLHRLAEHYLNPHKAGKVRDLAYSYCKLNCTNPTQSIRILLDLSKCAYEYELKVSTGILKLNPWSEKALSIVIPLKYKAMFEKLCKTRVVYNKKGSMQSVLEDYILRSLMNAYPNTIKDIQEYRAYRLKKSKK